MISTVLEHLGILVAADTTNPPRSITAEHPALQHVTEALAGAGFSVESVDHGDGSVNLHAVRGTPDLLFNCHLDTVPPDPNWQHDPFSLRIEHDHAVGLGACDIKGAAACLLTAAEATTGDAALLITTDEEAGQSRCVQFYLESNNDKYRAVVVAEPTECCGVTAHRGLVSQEVMFTGTGGHASSQNPRSATHDLCQWAALVLQDPSLADHRFNLGVINGGEKPNMIASNASARFGLRPAPGADSGALLRAIKSCASPSAQAEWVARFSGPPLQEHAESAEICERLGIAPAQPVDFWTEAALFAQHGIPAIVFGPGNIAQAHSACEFVEIEQLTLATQIYTNAFMRVAAEVST